MRRADLLGVRGEIREATEADEERAREDPLREQLRIQKHLLSHVSHELRTPLAAIDQFVSLVRDGVAGPVTPEQATLLGDALHNASQLGSLLDDLSLAARARDGKLRVERRPLDLAELVGESVRGLERSARARGVSLRAAIPPRLGFALGDDTRTRQILANLIDNAIKFSAEGGSVRVAAERDEATQTFRIDVRDDGCGIRPECLDTIFDRLQQDAAAGWRSRNGLGLGLFICRELVQLQGGRIWVESRLGEGSGFHFTLPMFSMAQLIRPALVDGESLRDAYSVVRVDLIPPEASRPLPPVLRHRIAQLVGGSIYPDVDVVLPRPEEARGGCWVLAGTGEAGMRSLVDRLRTRLGEQRELRRRGIRVEVEGFVESTRGTGASGALDEALTQLASRIAERTGGRFGPEETRHDAA